MTSYLLRLYCKTYGKKSYHYQSVTTKYQTVIPVKVRQGDAEVIALYENVFEQLPHFTLVPIGYPLAKIAASLRGKYSILLSDSFQIAACLKEQATLFVTNDTKLKKIKEIKVICLRDYV